MDKVLNLGQVIQIITNAICLDSLSESMGNKSYGAIKKKIERMEEYDINNLNESQKSNFDFFEKIFEDWNEWANKNGYITGFHQIVIREFYYVIKSISVKNYIMNQNNSEHLFCYLLAKVVFDLINIYKQLHPEESKQQAVYYTLANLEFFGDDEKYLEDFTPIASSFSLLTHWVKNINELITYWNNKITSEGKSTKNKDIKRDLKRWNKGGTPYWKTIKFFFDNDLCPPEEYFIDDERIKKDGYKTFERNLYFAFILTHLFDYLVKKNILSAESRKMIRNGFRLYYRDFYLTRNQDNEDYSSTFEPEAENNLMFRTLFCMIDGSLDTISLAFYMTLINEYPEFPCICNNSEEAISKLESLQSGS